LRDGCKDPIQLAANLIINLALSRGLLERKRINISKPDETVPNTARKRWSGIGPLVKKLNANAWRMKQLTNSI
jgi:hypothetical protein